MTSENTLLKYRENNNGDIEIMVDKLGFFRRVFTRKADKKEQVTKTELNKDVQGAKAAGKSQEVTLNSVWDNYRVQTPTSYTANTYTKSSDPVVDNAVAELDVKFGSTPLVAQRNTEQKNIEIPSLDDPNYISDMAQGFEENEFCEV